MASHKSTFRITLLIANASIGAYLFGYSMSYMNPALKTVSHLYGIEGTPNQKLVEGFLLGIPKKISPALPPIGAALGALASGQLLCYVGLREGFFITDLIANLGYALQLPVYVPSLMTARLLIGASLGLNSSLIPQYIKQFSPKALSGSLGAINQMTHTIGSLTGFVTGIFYSEDHSSADYLKLVFDLPMLFASLRLFLFAYIFLYNPPQQYLQKNELRSAKLVINSIYQPEYVDEILDELTKEVEEKKRTRQGFSDILTNRIYQRRLFVGCLLQIIQQLSGINAILFYSSQIFDDITNHDNKQKNLLNIGVGLTNVLFSIVAIFVLKRVGRRPPLIYGTLCCSICLWMIAGFSVNKDKFQIPILVFMYLYLAFFQLSLGPVVWLYIADILPEKGVAVAVLTNWVMCALVAQFFGVVNELGMFFSFGLFGGFCTAGTILIALFVKETKDKTKQEICDMYYQES